MKLTVLSFVLFMLLSGTISAQSRHHGPPPPPRPNLDSILASHEHGWDTIFHHPGGDTILVCHHGGHDTIPLPPHNGGGDSTSVGGGGHGHDTIPSPPPPPNWGDSTGAGNHHRDTIPGPPPSAWGDSIWGWFNGDSLPNPFPPHGGGGDTSSAGGGGIDTIPGPPPPPNWGDSTGAGGGNDSLPPHHRDELITASNTASATVLVFPNPVFETATIRVSNASSTVTFRMYESNGRMVRVISNLSNGDFQLSKETLTSGIYFYEMLDGNTIATKGSLVIQ